MLRSRGHYTHIHTLPPPTYVWTFHRLLNTGNAIQMQEELMLVFHDPNIYLVPITCQDIMQS